MNIRFSLFLVFLFASWLQVSCRQSGGDNVEEKRVSSRYIRVVSKLWPEHSTEFQNQHFPPPPINSLPTLDQAKKWSEYVFVLAVFLFVGELCASVGGSSLL